MNSGWRGYILGGLFGGIVAIVVVVGLSFILWPNTDNPWWFNVFIYCFGAFCGYQGAVLGNMVDQKFKVKNEN